MNIRQTSAQIIVAFLGGAGACLLSNQAMASPADACALISQAEVGTALGVAVGPGEHLTPTQTSYCTWHEEGNEKRRNVKVSVLTEQQYQLPKSMTSGPSVNTPETGIGDEAYFSKTKGMVYILSVKKGANYIRVQARSNADALAKSNDAANDEKDKDIDRAIAREILKKL